MSDLLRHDDDAIDPDGPNDIDVSRMIPNGTANNDYTIGGHPEFQKQIRQLLNEYDDIEGNVRTPNDIYSGYK